MVYNEVMKTLKDIVGYLVKHYILLTFFLFIVGYSACHTIDIDPSANAYDSGDYTLGFGLSNNTQTGFLFLRVTEHTPVTQTFTILPPRGLPGELLVLGCDGMQVGQSIVDDGKPVEIKMSELYPNPEWEASPFNCEIRVLAKFKLELPDGEIKTKFAVSFVRIAVLKSDYQVMPVDSPYADLSSVRWHNGMVQYSTSLRSANKTLTSK